MKRKTLLLAALAGLSIFIGCKDDEDDDDKINRLEIIEGESLNMKAGEKIVLHTKTYPENLEPEKYKWNWSSSAEDVVSVSPFGGITAIWDGEATITVTSLNNTTASIHVIVTPIEITAIKFKTANTKYEGFVGSELQIIPDSVLPINATHKNKLIYSSSDETIAKVNSNGKVEAIGVGNCQIKIASPDGDGTISATCELTIKSIDVVSLIPSDNNLGDSYSIKVGESYKIKTAVANTEWKTSDAKVADITADGTFTGVGAGDCYITAVGTNGEVKAKFLVTVTK